MNKKRIFSMLFLSIVLVLSTLVADGFGQRRHRRVHHSRTKGAIIGAVVGGIGGGLIGGKKGVVIGGAAGAGTGYLIQRHRNKRHRRHRY